MTTCRPSIVRQLEDAPAKRTSLSTAVLWPRYAACVALAKRVAYSDEKRRGLARAHPVWQRGQAMPGVGPLTATAILAAVPEAPHVTNGRQWAAWFGLVPCAHSTGGTPRLLGMSQRGDVYLRNLFVHGARAPLRWVDTQPDDRRQWLTARIARRGQNRAAGA